VRCTSVIGTNRSPTFRKPSIGRLPTGTCTVPANRSGGIDRTAVAGCFWMRISARGCPAMSGATMTRISSVATCAVPERVAESGAACSTMLAPSIVTNADGSWFRISATRRNGVWMVPVIRNADV
jgi:hypothetical protein